MTKTVTMTAKFAGTCTACTRRFPAGASILWTRGAGAKHATPAACAEAQATVVVPPVSIQVGEFAAVVRLFEQAKTKLKWPKITLVCGGTPITLALAGARSKTPGSIVVQGEGRYPDREWFGRVSPEGAWTPSRSVSPAFQVALAVLLAEFGARPAEVAKAHGRLTGHCCFCSLKLGEGEDKRSIAVGFGPKCAKNYGLYAEWRTGAASVGPDDLVVTVEDERNDAHTEADFGVNPDEGNDVYGPEGADDFSPEMF